jgi:hypothetical protein
LDTVLLGASNTSIQIEGLLDRAVIRMQKVSITVFCRDQNNGGLGTAIGRGTLWPVVVYLPRNQFADLLFYGSG